jgi:uncharacterized protein (TIGR00369 family)
MEFIEDGDEVISRWQPSEHFQGFHNVLHGGVQATLMDEIASWIIQVKLKTSGVTSSMESKFLKPVHTNQGKITIKAHILSKEGNLVHVNTTIYNPDGRLCTEGRVTYFVFPERLARRRLNYPGYDSFFDDQS